jgi:hypothetical protein
MPVQTPKILTPFYDRKAALAHEWRSSVYHRRTRLLNECHPLPHSTSNEPNLGSPHDGLLQPNNLKNGFFSTGKEKGWRAEPPISLRLQHTTSLHHPCWATVGISRRRIQSPVDTSSVELLLRTVVRRLYEERPQDYDYLAEGEPSVIWEATVFNVENIYYDDCPLEFKLKPEWPSIFTLSLKIMIIRSFMLLLFSMNKMPSSDSSFIISIFPSGSLKKREKYRRATQEPRLQHNLTNRSAPINLN